MNDFERTLTVLVRGRVEFVVIGGVAMYAHGSARLTRDLDICYERSRENIGRLIESLKSYHPRLRTASENVPFLFDSTTIERGLNFTLSTDLGDLDILGEVAGLGTYEEVWNSSVSVQLFGQPCYVLSLDGLIRSKRATGRSRDTDAVHELEALRELGREVSKKDQDEHSEF